MSLTTDIRAVIETSGASMGIAIRHLESGEETTINADQPFPLCSVLKIPVLAEAFRQMQAGKFSLDDRWELTIAEKNLPSGVLLFFEDGLQPTVRDLLTLMIIISDNTATDMIMHRLGTATINDYMHSLGLTNTHIKLTIREIFEDIMPSADPRQDLYDLARQRNQPGGLRRDGHAFSSGPDNDSGTPRDMTKLLTMIFQGDIVDRAACAEMLEILLKQQLNDRLPRYLPSGTRVAHKTGTLPGIRNDSGIIYVDDNNHVAITIFSTWDDQATDDPVETSKRIFTIDSAFGQIGRLIYDYYCRDH